MAVAAPAVASPAAASPRAGTTATRRLSLLDNKIPSPPGVAGRITRRAGMITRLAPGSRGEAALDPQADDKKEVKES
ncbi:hypothetical protein Misp02_09270 [Microtetraspora sp. NBRC 16547]|nr:hypothetical protein Misp02_09270 [Microtetraspora sp. NBRC 16547]